MLKCSLNGLKLFKVYGTVNFITCSQNATKYDIQIYLNPVYTQMIKHIQVLL